MGPGFGWGFFVGALVAAAWAKGGAAGRKPCGGCGGGAGRVERPAGGWR